MRFSTTSSSIRGFITAGAVMVLCLVPRVGSGAKNLKLADGKTIRILGMSTGTSHKFESTTLAEKAYRQLPKALQDLLPATALNGGTVQLTTEDSLAVGLALPEGTKAGTGYNVIMSDGAGWYNSADYIGMTNDLRVFAFSMAPRAARTVKLSFYDDSTPTAQKHLGDVTLPNPRYDSTLSRSTPPPKQVVAGAAEVEIVNFYTNLFLHPNEFGIGQKHSATKVLPPQVVDLLSGQAASTTFPRGGRSALVFRLKGETLTTAALVNASLTIQDSSGNIYKPWTRLFLSDDQQVLTWWRNMPTSDGNYELNLNLYQVPPPFSSAWKEMEITQATTAKQPGKLVLAGLEVTSEVSAEDPRKLLIKATGEPSLLALQMWDKATSTVIQPPTSLTEYPGGYDHKIKRHRCVVKLPDAATTGSLVLTLAECVQQPLKFSGVPKVPTLRR